MPPSARMHFGVGVVENHCLGCRGLNMFTVQATRAHLRLPYPVEFTGQLSCPRQQTPRTWTGRSPAQPRPEIGLGSWLDGEDLTGPDGSPRTKKEGARRERKFPTNESYQNTPQSKEEAERERAASHLVPFRKFNDSSLVGLIEVASFILKLLFSRRKPTEEGRRQKLDTIGARRFLSSSD